MQTSDDLPAASVAELLRGYRHAAALTQHELAERAAVSRGVLRPERLNHAHRGAERAVVVTAWRGTVKMKKIGT